MVVIYLNLHALFPNKYIFGYDNKEIIGIVSLHTKKLESFHQVDILPFIVYETSMIGWWCDEMRNWIEKGTPNILYFLDKKWQIPFILKKYNRISILYYILMNLFSEYVFSFFMNSTFKIRTLHPASSHHHTNRIIDGTQLRYYF